MRLARSFPRLAGNIFPDRRRDAPVAFLRRTRRGPALAFLNARAGDTISVTDAADGTLRVSSTKPEVSRQLEMAQDIMRRYRNTLRELAK